MNNFKRYPVKRFGAVAIAGSLALGLAACGAKTSSSTTKNTALASAASAASSADYFTDRDLSGNYDDTSATHITLSDSGSAVNGQGATANGSTVTITSEGTYVFSGSLSKGQIKVEADDAAKIQIVLNGVTISNSGSAAIYVKTADKVFITTAEGSNNSLTSSGNFAADGDIKVDGAIFSKQDLTINGKGSLTVKSSANGIVSKDDLKLTGSAVTVDAQGKGLEANDSIRIADGTYTINATDDSVHADSSDTEAGFFYMSGGTLALSSGDDGIHADGKLNVVGGKIVVNKSNEGLEGSQIVIDGGDINVTSQDDGLNAAGDSNNSSDYSITINGGRLEVNASGDGIDSNGDLYINGGETYVSGATNNGDATLDYGDRSKGVITGGTVIATGYSGMAESFDSSSTQGMILYGLNNTSSETVTVTDSSGNVLASYTPPKNYNAVYVSAPGMTSGNSYTIAAGSSKQTIDLDSMITTSGNINNRGMGGPGGMSGSGGAGGPGGMGGSGSAGGPGGMGNSGSSGSSGKSGGSGKSSNSGKPGASGKASGSDKTTKSSS